MKTLDERLQAKNKEDIPYDLETIKELLDELVDEVKKIQLKVNP